MYNTNASIPDDINNLTSLRNCDAPNPVNFSNLVPLNPLFTRYLTNKITTSNNNNSTHAPISPLQVSWEVTNPTSFDNSTGFTPFNELAGIAATSDGDFYIAEKQLKILYKFNSAAPDKALMWSFKPDPQQGLIYGIAVADNLPTVRKIILLVLRIIAGKSSWHVVILSEKNSALVDAERIEVNLTSPNDEWITGITTDSSGYIYVASVKHVLRLQPDGSNQQHMRIFPDGTNDVISSLAISDVNNALYVLNNTNSRITSFPAFQSSITPVAPGNAWGKSGTGEGEFQSPSFIAVTNNFVYITDLGDQRIQKFDAQGTFLAQAGGPVPETQPAQASGYLGRPAFISVTTEGMYIIDTAGYPQKVIHATDLANEEQQANTTNKRKSSSRIIDLRLATWAHSLQTLQTEYAHAKILAELAQIKVQYLVENVPADTDEIETAQQVLHHTELELEAIDESLKSFHFFLRSEGFRESADQLVSALLQRHQNNINEYYQITSELHHADHRVDIRKYTTGRGGLIDQYGIPLFEHIKQFNKIDDHMVDNVLIIPLTEEDDQDDNELTKKLLLVFNPVFNKKQLRPPSVLFEEKYSLYISWSNISLGELSHTESLMPGEQRSILLETTSKKSIQTRYKSKRLTSSKRISDNSTSSIRKDDFESKIHDSFKNTSQKGTKYSSSNTSSFETNYNATLETIFNIGAKGSGNSSHTINSGSSSTLSSITERVSDIVRTAQQEVSENNKVSISSESSSDNSYEESISFEDMRTEKTEVHLENINEGKTINYLFFQIANNYSSILKSEDLKIFIDSGIELFDGSGITASGSYDIEHYMSIYDDYDIFPSDNDLRQDIVNAIAADILLRYIKIGSTDISDESPRLLDVKNILHEELRILRQALEDSLDPLSATGVEPVFNVQHPSGVFDKISTFQSNPIIIEPLQLGEKLLHQINTNSYFLDAHIGFMPATEEYLEIRRTIETEKQQAIVDELRNKISSGVFHTSLPDGITALSTS